MQQIKISNRITTESEIIFLLAGYKILPLLWRELIIDQAIANIECFPEERSKAKEQFDKKYKLNTLAERQAWQKHYGMTLEQLNKLSTRELRIEKFKQLTWGHQLEAYFLKHKSKLDKVIYSLIRTTDSPVAQELYFRIQAEEQSFADLAREYSDGPEAQTGGLLGPVELSQPHPVLAKMLAMSQPRQLLPPTRLGEWFVIVRLEKFIPAQLDEPMRQQLLNILFETWLVEQLNQLEVVQLPDTQKGLMAV